MCRRREEEEEDEVVETATAQTQTDVDGGEAESFEMVELREEVVGTVFLHPAPTPSPSRKPPRQPSPPAAADPGPSTSTIAALAVTPQLQRLTTEEIAERLHSHGAGSKNVPPG